MIGAAILIITTGSLRLEGLFIFIEVFMMFIFSSAIFPWNTEELK